MSSLTPNVEEAVEEVRRFFPDSNVLVMEDGSGGAYVIVDDLPIGSAFSPARSWIGFPIPYMYPAGDIYPHWMDAGVTFADGRPMSAPFQPGQQIPLFNRPAIMISRRSNRWNPAQDKAWLKVHRILKFLEDHAPAEQEAA